MEVNIEIASIKPITISEISTGILKISVKHIFKPTNTKTAARPYFKYRKYFTIPARAKNKDLNPRIANTLEV